MLEITEKHIVIKFEEDFFVVSENYILTSRTIINRDNNYIIKRMSISVKELLNDFIKEQ